MKSSPLKLGWMAALLAALALPAGAALRPGSISGTVRDSSGVPQLGAVVQVLGAAPDALTLFTDERGKFSAIGLLPGNYQIKVTATSFLPLLRENVSLRSGANLIINLTLNTLFEAVRMIPMHSRSAEDDDDWKWTLRSTANRPILRVLDAASPVVVSNSDHPGQIKARVMFLAGAEGGGFGSSADRATSFKLEKSLFSTGTLSLGGNVGNVSGSPVVLRASYAHEFSNGDRPEVTVTMRRFAGGDLQGERAALQALALTLSNQMRLSDFAEVEYGAQYEAIQFLGRTAALQPFGTLDIHLSPDSVVEYRYTTSLPNSRASKGFESAPADLSESGPRVSIVQGTPHVEKIRHQELSFSRRVGNNNFQVAAYSDRINNAALVGTGNAEGSFLTGSTLDDPYSDNFSYNGGNLHTSGLRAVAQRKISSLLTATLDYAYGGALALKAPEALSSNLPQDAFEKRRRHALAAKLEGRVPGPNTRWTASYKWSSGEPGLTAVDAFNASAGQADPYLSFFIRQPLPSAGFLPRQMEALVDVRNLLAQGYLPVMGQDGHIVYLVQSARCVRGGVAFSF